MVRIPRCRIVSTIRRQAELIINHNVLFQRVFSAGKEHFCSAISGTKKSVFPLALFQGTWDSLVEKAIAAGENSVSMELKK